MMIVRDGPAEDPIPLSEARRRLVEPEGVASAFRMVMAAALLAASACCLAMAVILGPFWQINHPHMSTASLQPAAMTQRHAPTVTPAAIQTNAIVAAPPARVHA